MTQQSQNGQLIGIYQVPKSVILDFQANKAPDAKIQFDEHNHMVIHNKNQQVKCQTFTSDPLLLVGKLEGTEMMNKLTLQTPALLRSPHQTPKRPHIVQLEPLGGARPSSKSKNQPVGTKAVPTNSGPTLSSSKTEKPQRQHPRTSRPSNVMYFRDTSEKANKSSVPKQNLMLAKIHSNGHDQNQDKNQNKSNAASKVQQQFPTVIEDEHVTEYMKDLAAQGDDGLEQLLIFLTTDKKQSRTYVFRSCEKICYMAGHKRPRSELYPLYQKIVGKTKEMIVQLLPEHLDKYKRIVARSQGIVLPEPEADTVTEPTKPTSQSNMKQRSQSPKKSQLSAPHTAPTPNTTSKIKLKVKLPPNLLSEHGHAAAKQSTQHSHPVQQTSSTATVSDGATSRGAGVNKQVGASMHSSLGVGHSKGADVHEDRSNRSAVSAGGVNKREFKQKVSLGGGKRVKGASSTGTAPDGAGPKKRGRPRKHPLPDGAAEPPPKEKKRKKGDKSQSKQLNGVINGGAQGQSGKQEAGGEGVDGSRAGTPTRPVDEFDASIIANAFSLVSGSIRKVQNDDDLVRVRNDYAALAQSYVTLHTAHDSAVRMFSRVDEYGKRLARTAKLDMAVGVSVKKQLEEITGRCGKLNEVIRAVTQRLEELKAETLSWQQGSGAH